MIKLLCTIPKSVTTVIKFFFFVTCSSLISWYLFDYYRGQLKIFYFSSTYTEIDLLNHCIDVFRKFSFHIAFHVTEVTFFMIIFFFIGIIYLYYLDKSKQEIANNTLSELLINDRDTTEIVQLISTYEKKLIHWQEEVIQKRKCLTRIIDIVPFFIFAKDRDGRFMVVNKAVADCYGVHPRDIIGKKDSDFTSNTYKFLRDDNNVMDTDTAMECIEETIECCDGRTFYLMTNKYPFNTWDGKPAVLGISRIIENDD